MDEALVEEEEELEEEQELHCDDATITATETTISSYSYEGGGEVLELNYNEEIDKFSIDPDYDEACGPLVFDTFCTVTSAEVEWDAS